MTNTMNSPVCDQCDCVAGCSKNPEPCPILLAERIDSGQVSAQQIEAHRAAGEIHSCSYYCDRPACVSAQRDELRAQLEAVGAGGVSGPLMGAVPGWKLVPLSLTRSMVIAAAKSEEVEDLGEDLSSMWRAMLSAAPQPPTAQPAEGLFVDMIESHGPDFVSEMFHQSAQPADSKE